MTDCTKHSSFLRYIVNEDSKKFYNVGPRKIMQRRTIPEPRATKFSFFKNKLERLSLSDNEHSLQASVSLKMTTKRGASFW